MELILSISIIVLLLVVFFVTYVVNKKTPVPEGCEDIKISEEGCSSCSNTSCHIKTEFDLKKIEKELKELEDNKEEK